MKDLTLKFHLSDSEYFTALRLVAGSVCTNADLDIDALEDFKVCITESALILKNCGFEIVEITFSYIDGVQCTVQGLGGNSKQADNTLSLALISALVSVCDIKENQGIIERVTLKV
ncbi:MAG: hypothetical protein E7370_04165 [Clostridiales bacterium]|nr:hypothetical protein [Clostridiales bacterium]